MKIFITYASAGAGHQMASEAIFDAFKRAKRPDIHVKLINTLDYSSKIFRFLYPRIYLFSIKRLSFLWGMGYYVLDFPPLYFFLKILRRIINSTNSRGFVRFLTTEKPDMIITTHFMATEVISAMKRKNNFSGKLITVVTDFGLHSFWVEKEVDRFVVASLDTKQDLVKRGISADRIYAFGIPISRAFSMPQPKNIIRESLGLSGDLLTVLLVGGGFGTGPISKIVRLLANIDYPIQVIVVCGKNPKLYNRIEKIAKTVKTPLLVYAFTKNMPALMNAADLVITKPGGITISEAMAMTVPLMIVSPIPGQEAKNCKYLLKHNAGIRIKSVSSLREEIVELFNSPHKLLQMKEHIKEIAKPNSSADIVNTVLAEYAK